MRSDAQAMRRLASRSKARCGDGNKRPAGQGLWDEWQSKWCVQDAARSGDRRDLGDVERGHGARDFQNNKSCRQVVAMRVRRSRKSGLAASKPATQKIGTRCVSSVGNNWRAFFPNAVPLQQSRSQASHSFSAPCTTLQTRFLLAASPRAACLAFVPQRAPGHNPKNAATAI